jgi:hypothetical protein
VGKLNCWESKKCERHPGGLATAELGTCPAATEVRVARLHGGVKGGRASWAIAGTLCGGVVRGPFAAELSSGSVCPSYLSVRDEEGPGFVPAKDILPRFE